MLYDRVCKMYNSTDYTNDFNTNVARHQVLFYGNSFLTYVQTFMGEPNNRIIRTCAHAKYEAKEAKAICTYTTLQKTVRRSILG